MADRLVALLGPGVGPEVPLLGRRAKIRVNGLREGERVAVTLQNGKGVVSSSIKEDGDHSIECGRMVSVSHEGTSIGLICEVIRGSI